MMFVLRYTFLHTRALSVLAKLSSGSGLYILRVIRFYPHRKNFSFNRRCFIRSRRQTLLQRCETSVINYVFHFLGGLHCRILGLYDTRSRRKHVRFFSRSLILIERLLTNIYQRLVFNRVPRFVYKK